MKEEFFRHVEISRIPVRVIMQLTYNCNFRCVHCYQTPLKQECSNYVTANEWKPFLKELRERGCMFLAFTGGELFSYPDFCTLYEFAYDLGYKITLTTNGSLINDVHMELFKKYKPEAVFITLYGMSELTYKEFTNTTGAYKKVVNNIDKLLKNDIRVVVKYLSTTITKKDLKKAYAYAKSKKMLFYQYYKLRAFCNGDCSAKKIQLTPRELIRNQPPLELNGIIDSVYSPYDNEWEKGYKKCMAGVTNLEIDPSGMAFLCDNVPAERFSIFEYDFDYIWKKLYQQRKEYIERDSVCVKCQNHDKCGLCAPTILLEYGSYYSKPITECVFMERLEECLKERTKDETCR